MGQFTPGPWEWKGAGIFCPQYMLVARVGCTPAHPRVEQEANARLIAAAPAYAIVWQLVPDDMKGRIFDALHKHDTEWVEAAIARAEGRAP